VQARTLYALRRVVRCKRAIFQPHLHPEVASVQLQLAQQLATVARHCAKGTHAQKVRLDQWKYPKYTREDTLKLSICLVPPLQELLRECTDVLAEIGTSRCDSRAFYVLLCSGLTAVLPLCVFVGAMPLESNMC
jgi:hypothetical protein